MSGYCRLLQQFVCINHDHAVLHSKPTRKIVQGESHLSSSAWVRFCTILGFIPTSARDLFPTVMSYSYFCSTQPLFWLFFCSLAAAFRILFLVYFVPVCMYLNFGFFLGFRTPQKFGVIHGRHPSLCLI